WDAPVTVDSLSPSKGERVRVRGGSEILPTAAPDDGVALRLTINQLSGWWNGVATGDFDGDGRLDIVASNWGLNSPYRASREHPRRLYYADFAGRGTVDLIEAGFDAELGKEVPDRTLKAVGAAIPLLIERIQTHSAFGTASVQEILGEQLKSAGRAEVTTLASMVFLNRGNR